MLMVNCTPKNEVKPIPTISITPSIPPINNENITGQIHGAEAHLYSVYIYALTPDGWFNILNNGSASIRIAEDKSWICELNNIKKDEINKLAIYLIPNGYSPPILLGDPIIPIKINLAATAKKIIEIES